MTCRDLVDFLDDYVSDELSADERTRFDGHLAECPACATYLKSYREAIKLGKAVLRASDDSVPGDVPEQLVQAILASRKRK